MRKIVVVQSMRNHRFDPYCDYKKVENKIWQIEKKMYLYIINKENIILPL
jgi:hypothetical protein